MHLTIVEYWYIHIHGKADKLTSIGNRVPIDSENETN